MTTASPPERVRPHCQPAAGTRPVQEAVAHEATLPGRFVQSGGHISGKVGEAASGADFEVVFIESELRATAGTRVDRHRRSRCHIRE